VILAAALLLQAVSAGDYLTLRNQRLEAAVSPKHGGELASLRVRFRGRWIETLYRALDYSATPGWTGKAPLLWPATGRNSAGGADSYRHNGRRYQMPIHGFARNFPWKIEAHGEMSAAVSFEDTAETRKMYPFGFRLTVEYKLTGSALHAAYTVRAKDALFFSIGNHITFKTPLVDGSDPEQMTFETPSSIEYLKDSGNLPTGERQPRSFAKPVRLGDFKAVPAISLGGYAGDPWMRLTDPAGLSLHLSHRADSLPAPPVLQFNIWGDAKAGYFSPEPWVGIQNSLNLRQGLVILPAGATWKWTFTVTASGSD
jgi:galactose mutarotase-like enzyme